MSALKDLRKSKGMTQRELARKVGIPAQVISHYEQGVQELSHAAYYKVVKIARALGVTVEELTREELR